MKHLRVIDAAAIDLDDKPLVHDDGYRTAFGCSIPLLEGRRVAEKGYARRKAA